MDIKAWVQPRAGLQPLGGPVVLYSANSNVNMGIYEFGNFNFKVTQALGQPLFLPPFSLHEGSRTRAASGSWLEKM